MSKTYVFGKGPGATHTTGHKDVGLSYDSDDADYANEAIPTNADLAVGLYNTLGPLYTYKDITLMRFNLSAIPQTETVQSAILRLVNTGSNVIANSQLISVVQMTTAWGVTDTDEGTDEDPAVSEQATYNNAKARAELPIAWGEGPNFDAVQPYSELSPPVTIPVLAGHTAGQTYDVDLTALVQAWVNGTPGPLPPFDPLLVDNHGIALINLVSPTDFDDWFGFGSQNSSVEAKRWTLTVVTDGEGASPLVNGVWPRPKFVEQRQ